MRHPNRAGPCHPVTALPENNHIEVPTGAEVIASDPRITQAGDITLCFALLSVGSALRFS